MCHILLYIYSIPSFIFGIFSGLPVIVLRFLQMEIMRFGTLKMN